MDYRRKIFKGFFIPGLIIELLIILCIILPESINPLYGLSFLKIRVGGPAGWAVSMTLLPLQIQVIYFFIISAFYSIRLPILYKRGNDKFATAVRNFLIYGDMALVALLAQIIILLSSLSAKDFEWYVNLAVVIPVFVFGILMCLFFIYWTAITYKERHLRLFSKETLRSIGTAILFVTCITLVIAAVIAICVAVAESNTFIERVN